MGIVGKRKQEDEEAQTQVAAGKALWLESCSSCGRPMSVLAAVKPESVICDRCQAPT